MRLNRYIASAAGISRRSADDLISSGKVLVDNKVAELGLVLSEDQRVTLDGVLLQLPKNHVSLIVNKPLGIVVSRNGQGSQTIYDILPEKYNHLNPVGRLDKNSTGLLVMSSDGVLANKLAHPSANKTKGYLISLDKPLSKADQILISNKGVNLEDGLSQFRVTTLKDSKNLKVMMHEGRNRQIRRTFAALGYEVKSLHRYKFANFSLEDIKPGNYRVV